MGGGGGGGGGCGCVGATLKGKNLPSIFKGFKIMGRYLFVECSQKFFPFVKWMAAKSFRYIHFP